MGIFSKTPKPNPKITVEGIEFHFVVSTNAGSLEKLLHPKSFQFGK